MPSYLDDVVKAMMFEPTEERPDSTLGWDVVVNYAFVSDSSFLLVPSDRKFVPELTN